MKQWGFKFNEDQISVPERFHVSQLTLSRLRRRMLKTGSLNDHFRSGRPKVATGRQDRDTPLLHLRNHFQASVFLGQLTLLVCLNFKL
jgi:transposase